MREVVSREEREEGGERQTDENEGGSNGGKGIGKDISSFPLFFFQKFIFCIL